VRACEAATGVGHRLVGGRFGPGVHPRCAAARKATPNDIAAHDPRPEGGLPAGQGDRMLIKIS
jgi:hypothetical protein